MSADHDDFCECQSCAALVRMCARAAEAWQKRRCVIPDRMFVQVQFAHFAYEYRVER